MDRNTLRKMWCYLIPSAQKRTRFLIRKKVFKEVGDHFVFFPRKIPQDPQFIRFGNNVVVATEVMFINHDIIHEMFNGISKDTSGGYMKHWGCIEVKDNVFLGAKSMIMPGITLGPNMVVAAGSVVTKDFSGGVVIGGNPARVIGDMQTLMNKRLRESGERRVGLTKIQEAERAWLERKKKGGS